MHNIRPFLPSWKQWDQFITPIHDPKQLKTFINNGRVVFNHLQIAHYIKQNSKLLFAILGMKNNTYPTYRTYQNIIPMAWVTTDMLADITIAKMYSNAFRKDYIIHREKAKIPPILNTINQELKKFAHIHKKQERYFFKNPWAKTRKGTYIQGYGNIEKSIYKILALEMTNHPKPCTIQIDDLSGPEIITPELMQYVKKYYSEPKHKLIFNGRDAT